MKTLSVTLLVTLLFVSADLLGQSLAPPKIWDKRFGGLSYDYQTCLLPLPDGNFLAGGSSSSNIGGDKTQNSKGGFDYWVVKIDPSGNKIWDKTFGGSSNDYMFDMILLDNGKVILSGHSTSPASGDKTQNTFGNTDLWIVEIDQNGIKIWDKDFGGTSNDYVMKAIESLQHHIFFVGSSNSTANGNKTTPSFGNDDIWIVKTDTSGNLLGDYAIGGSGEDYGRYIDLLPDGNLVIGAAVLSGISGNITSASYGNLDYLVVKISETGNIIWQKRFGGTGVEGIQFVFDYNFKNIVAVKSVGQHIAVCSLSKSDVGGNKTTAQYPGGGGSDYWFILLDQNGNQVYQKEIGGNALDDDLSDMFIDNENNILISCTSYSNASFDKTQNNLGYESTWVLRLDTLQNIIWDRTVLENSHAEVSLVCELSNGSFIMGNSSTAGIGGDKTQNTQGSNDYFMICLAAAAPPEANLSVVNQNVCVGTCANFAYTGSLYPVGTVQWSFPGGNPSTAIGYNPQVCYNTSGYFDVQVIASNSLGADTLYLPNYIHVLQNVNPVLSYSGGVLVCNTGVTSVAFQWYLSGVAISGATDSTWVPLIDGVYSVIVNPGSVCPITITYTVNNLPPYIQSMNANMNYLCPNNCIQFSAATFNTPTTYEWIFQGGSPPTSSLVSPSNICYPNAGTFDVTLIVHNIYGYDTLYYPGYIHVLNLSPIIINQNDTLICNTVGASYQWYINNNPIAGATNQSYVPTQPGNYLVMVTSYIGCAAFSNIVVMASPVASFILGNNTICEGECIPFVNSSTNTPNTFQWTFNGGNPASSTSSSPTICFDSSGTFDVQMIVSNQFGADTFNCTSCVTVMPQPVTPVIVQNGTVLTSSVTATYYQWYLNGVQIGGANNQSYTATQNGYYSVEIIGVNGCSATSPSLIFTINTLPTALFTSNQIKICQAFCITYSDQTLNNPTSWEWSFPGGVPSSSTLQNPFICYLIPGVYDVTLISHNSFGSDTVTVSGYITVFGIPPANITYQNDTLFAPVGSYTYQWDLNGSAIAGATNSFYVPTVSGNYNVTVYTSFGCHNTSLAPYAYSPAPLSSFISGNPNICVNNCLYFSSTSSNSPTSIQWYFPGGTPSSSTLSNPIICYYSTDTFSVELITSNLSGSDTLYQNNFVIVNPSPVVTISLTGGTITSTVTNGGGPFTYQWHENGSTIIGGNNSTYVPTSGGVYNVVVSNSSGCTGISNDISVTVNSPPQINLMSSDSNICAGTCINFTDLSVNFPTSWFWTIGGGNPGTTTQQNPIICFTQPGDFDVTLIASNVFGSDTFYFPQMIHVLIATPPTITQSGDTLFALGTGIIAYQWYGGSGSISGATNNYFVPDSSGIYNVNANYQTGCNAFNLLSYKFFDIPVPHIASSDTIICQNDCIDFFDQSSNLPYSWQWSFTGATTPSSILQNPTGICFPNVGIYSVSLSVSNFSGTGTTVFNSFVQVLANPAPIISYSGGNLVCNYPNGSGYTFEWYLNGIFIASAGTYTLTPVGNGDYTVVVISSDGCRGTSVPYIITGEEKIDPVQIKIFIRNDKLIIDGCGLVDHLLLFNTIGQKLDEIIPEGKTSCSIPLIDYNADCVVVEIYTIDNQLFHQLIVNPK